MNEKLVDMLNAAFGPYAEGNWQYGAHGQAGSYKVNSIHVRCKKHRNVIMVADYGRDGFGVYLPTALDNKLPTMAAELEAFRNNN